ncbi:protein of unknown function DUF37 [Citrifermentans bemidjiense Bem]|uniref:Putative membrane protein insertion efficiency factor n=2 Tax=Geobacteraceae TaxID=213422 RepID=E1P6F2_CITBB|nr:protein of unknown function DUF37 [Citrifermentans bemidjiense Bem]
MTFTRFQQSSQPPSGGCEKSMLKEIFIGLVVFYQRFISPLKAPSCRFYPTCSHYSLQALEKYGPVKGLWLTAARVLKCHPFHPGGYDPVK